MAVKTMKNLLKQEREQYKVPRKVQDIIPIKSIWTDGIFLAGGRYTKTWKFSDINYLVASREDKEAMFLSYSELLNSLDSEAVTKITINNHTANKNDIEKAVLMKLKDDGLDKYRREYNDILMKKALNANGIVQEKYITVSVAKKSIEEARQYFLRVESELEQHFAAVGSKCREMDAEEKLKILRNFYRSGETDFELPALSDIMRKGHDFRDTICPDSVEKRSDYLMLGNRYVRVLFLKDYANFIRDSFVSELTDLNRNMMLSIDVIPVPTEEAVREVERRLLGVETNITN